MCLGTGKEGAPYLPHSRPAASAAGLRVSELGMPAPVLPLLGSAWPSNEGEKMQKHSKEPTAPGKCEASS